MLSLSRLIALVQLIRKRGHQLNFKREMERLQLMWECPAAEGTLTFACLALAEVNAEIYLGAVPPIKFNCSPGASPAEWRVIPGCEDVGKVRLLPQEGFTFLSLVWFGLVLFGLRGDGSSCKSSSSDCWSWAAESFSHAWQGQLVGGNLHLQHFYSKNWANRPHSESIAFIIDEAF